MAIKSTLIHYDSYEYAASFTYAADAKNTQYRKGPEGTEVKPATSVDPQITWDKFVIIKDAKMFWTHGQVYKFYTFEDMMSALQVFLDHFKDEFKEEVNEMISENTSFVMMEQSELENLKARDCEENVLYLGLGEIIDSDNGWRFGEAFPIVFS